MLGLMKQQSYAALWDSAAVALVILQVFETCSEASYTSFVLFVPVAAAEQVINFNGMNGE